MIKFPFLTADDIECRVSQINDKGLSLLLYKDARCDMRILDETVGLMNWQRSHIRDNANCIVSIWDAEKEQWISKEDTGTESNTEKEKGLASDSFKRACFNWGIGRELYTAPFIWVKSDQYTVSDRNGKPTTYDRFKCSYMRVEDGKIVALNIENTKTHRTVYVFGDVLPSQDNDPICDQCGAKIEAMTGKNSRYYPVGSVVEASIKNYGKVLCAKCREEADKCTK